ncbi:MAG TPA: aminotransferase class V-fold PLP-dependent enzyme [Terrimicrobiaceae bacterium]|nr:aminotransferase class V-fold PLP-dependent enzyme [Terrimicrobiaceae bacterium]
MSPFASEAERLERFPVAAGQIFVAHAGVTPLPRCAADAMIAYIRASCERHQEFGEVLRDIDQARKVSADLIGADKSEIALLGPTSLGLSLFANGIAWREGDEVVIYQDDYPSNVYPWMALASQGINLRRIRPEGPGRLTPELVAGELSARTRLVALASCHYLSGWRVDVETMGALLRERGVLFSVDAIQTLGAFPLRVQDVDFLSADAHKWMLGPMAIGIVFVAKRNFELCRPTLLGAWNVESPEFLAQDVLKYHDTARRYEPGVLNVAGVYGMRASLEMLARTGPDVVASAILEVRDYLHGLLENMGFEFLCPPRDEPLRSGIVTARHPRASSQALFAALEKAKITASLRSARGNGEWLRFSMHFYNTREEMDRIADALGKGLA